MEVNKSIVFGSIIGIVLMVTIIFFSSGDVENSILYVKDSSISTVSVSSNSLRIGNITLVDHTVYDPLENTCLASNLGMKIFVEDCHTNPLSPISIQQKVYFNWTGINPQDTSWVFVYEGELESGSMKWFDKTTQHQETINGPHEQYINNYLIDNVVSYNNLGTPQVGMCALGNENNSLMYNVSRTNSNGTFSQIICFSQQTPVSSTSFRISGYATINSPYTITVNGTWKKVNVEYMGRDLLGRNFSYYKVNNKTFQPNESVETLWTYTPNNREMRGKWHILGYAGEDINDLMSALNNNYYVYMDPSWEANLNTGLEAWYKLNESAGTNALESVFGVWNGTAQNGVVLGSAGIIGTSYDFDGTNDDVYLANTNLFDGLTDFSVSVWVYPDSVTGTHLIIGDDSGTSSGRIEIGTSGTSMWIRLQGEAGAVASGNTTITTAGWQHLVFVRDDGDRYFYYGGSLVDHQTGKQSGAMGNPLVTYIGARDSVGTYAFDGNIDELAVYNRTLNTSEVLQLYNGGVGVTFELPSPPSPEGDLNVQLLLPPNNTLSSNTSFNFTINQTATETLNNTNITLMIWNSTNNLLVSNTTSISGNGTVIVSWIVGGFIDGEYLWDGYGCADNSSGDANCTRSYTGNYTFEVDTILPEINLTTPIGDILIENTEFPQNVTLNYTATDNNLGSCWYYTSDNSTNITITCNTSRGVPFSSEGYKTIYYFANDTLGQESGSNVSFDIGVFTQSVDINPIGEGQQALFSLELNKSNIGLEVLNSTLRYNNTFYGYTALNIIDNDHVVFGRALIIPDGTGSSTGNTILWNWTFNSSSMGVFDGAVKNQTVYSVAIDDCTSYGDIILNMSLYDEATNDFVNVTAGSNIQVDVSLSSIVNNNIFWSYSQNWDNNVSALICVPFGLLNNSEYRLDLVAEYSSTDHITEFYYIDNGTLSSSVVINPLTNRTISLFDLETIDSTTFLFSFLDEDTLEVPNAIVHTFRQYIGDGQFREVERSKQDDNGETHTHLVEEDVIYYFVISDSSEVLFTSSTYNAKCLSTPCSIELEASPEFVSFPNNWQLIPNGSFYVDSNGVSRNVYLSFASNVPVTMNLTVAKQDYQNGISVVGSTQTTASSGNISVNVPEIAGNVTYYAIVYLGGEYIDHELVDFNDKSDFYGHTGAGMGFLLVLSLILMGATEGIMIFFFMILSLILVSALALIKVSYAAIIGFICAMAILIYKLNKKGRTFR